MPPTASTSTYVPTLLPNYASRPIRRSSKACFACRRAKSRCNGVEELPCRRCREGGIVCEWKGGAPIVSNDVVLQAVADASPSNTIRVDTVSNALEARLIRMEQELNSLRSITNSQTNQLRTLQSSSSSTNTPPPTSTNGILSLPNGPISGLSTNGILSLLTGGGNRPTLGFNHTLTGSSPFSNYDSDGGETISLDDPAIELIARRCFDEFFSSCQTWAPCISPLLDTYDLVRVRSPILLYAILAISSRFQDNSTFTSYCEEEGLKHIRATLYSSEPPTLDQLKATVIWNAWLGKSSPPGHSLSLALSLGVDTRLTKILKFVDSDLEVATAAFEEYMPAVRTWCSLYAQDLWLSVASGRRSLVTIDYSLISARSLMKYAMLTPKDTRLIAQAELVTILASVQEVFSKTQLHTVDETVEIITQADEKLDAWRLTWEAWAAAQETATALYMGSSFLMQFSVGRFYINTLCLQNISHASQITVQQMPCIKASINSALQIQTAAAIYGSDRLRHSTEFTLVSVSSGALFLLKMIKLLPSAVNIPAALAAVQTTSNLLISAPIKQYHLAVASAYSHLASQLSMVEPTSHLKLNPELPTTGLDENVFIGDTDLVFDPELELALSSVIHDENFWSWEQTLPSDSFASVLS